MSVMDRPAVESDASQRLIESATQGMLGPNPFIGFRPQDITAAFRELAHQAVQHPAMVLEQEAALLRELIAILSGSSKLAAAPGDRRFADAAWQDNPLYRICLQTYLAWANSVTQFVDQSALDQRTKQRVRFAASLLTDALAPTNTLFGNPAALRSTLASGGANLVAGLKNMLADMATNGAMPSQVDKSAFKLGENLALSKGAVVLTTPVLELIQYSPRDRCGSRAAAPDRPSANQQVLLFRPVSGPQHDRIPYGKPIPGVRNQLAQSDRRRARLGHADLRRGHPRGHRDHHGHHELARRHRARRLLRRDDRDHPGSRARGAARAAGPRDDADGGGARRQSGHATWVVFHSGGDCCGKIGDDAPRGPGGRRDEPRLCLDAAERPDLELLDQQLSDGESAACFRHPVLEQRHHPSAGEVS